MFDVSLNYDTILEYNVSDMYGNMFLSNNNLYLCVVYNNFFRPDDSPRETKIKIYSLVRKYDLLGHIKGPEGYILHNSIIAKFRNHYQGDSYKSEIIKFNKDLNIINITGEEDDLYITC